MASFGACPKEMDFEERSEALINPPDTESDGEKQAAMWKTTQRRDLERNWRERGPAITYFIQKKISIDNHNKT